MTLSINQLHQNAIKALNQGDIQQAHQYLVSIVQTEPQHADAYFLLAMINVQVGQVKKAIALIEKALEFDNNTEYLAQLAKCYALDGQLEQAKATATQVNLAAVNSALTADTLGVAMSHIGLHEQAMSFYKKALEITQTNPQFYYNYGVCAKFLGDFAQAEQAFEKAIQINPTHHQAHFALSDLIKATNDSNHLERLNSVFSNISHPDAQLHIGHALAKEYQDLKQYDQAFEALNMGKKAKLKQARFDNDASTKLFAHIKTLSEEHKQISQIGHNSNEPIFVLGMPRSGTTLVERILSSHSDVMSAGELQDFGICTKRLAQTKTPHVLDNTTLDAAYQLDFGQLGQAYLDATRVVTGNSAHFIDKLPFNFFYVDLIRKALPNAKIVCLLRNPLDTCIGNYRQLFTINNPYYRYSLSLMDTAKFYARFYHLMQHWQALHGSHFKLLQYESLVNNPEHHIRDLLNFCDLPWQSQCIDFHLNTTPVSTASKVQVREPLNSKSIGRWRNFESHLEEVINYLTSQDIPISE
ncbi:tetratricopeptide repeat-containing sulfotransferase family protein [Pseudoalteromonas sp. S16_S37]|uniref:tetratricopeptide repeat-containing sulfotransferase family protein n=1 Tax=Pseudoalteromonas sp. S16_S37 TaxID=2720228 RepID=UPI0016818324|nr:tetratricopeptide repeat-containing sulfotransferase family protein [Pseudoalteromonas sp. S16_S37]MBD1582633.1 tetratricopeptide repeat protein [Pseudoalteromonas sp. S16_S37]